MLPHLNRISVVPKSGNAIIQLTFLIYGKQGSGKTTLIQTIVEHITSKYGLENVNAVWSKSNLDVLLGRGIQDKLVNVLCCEDITLRRFKTETLAEFFNIRHRVHALTKRRNGLVINIFTLHRYFGIKIELRTEHDLLLFRSAPDNPYDRSSIKRFLGEYYTDELCKIIEERDRDLSKMGLTAYYRRNKKGIVDFPKAEKNYVVELYQKRRSISGLAVSILVAFFVWVLALFWFVVRR